MRGNELLDKLERIDPAYIEAADTAPKSRHRAHGYMTARTGRR